MLVYEKSVGDADREKQDFNENPIMKYLRYQDHFKFNVGDILIKQTRWYSHHSGTMGEWTSETTQLGVPKKYMYVFENELGIGYLKQLCVDGKRFATALICTANFDAETTRFMLDESFVDHLLVGGEDSFQHNKEYLEVKKFREDAIRKNKKLVICTNSAKGLFEWWEGLKVGDEFWYGESWDDLIGTKCKVKAIHDKPISQMPQYEVNRLPFNHAKYIHTWRTIEIVGISSVSYYGTSKGQTCRQSIDHYIHRKVSTKEPFPLKDELRGTNVQANKDSI